MTAVRGDHSHVMVSVRAHADSGGGFGKELTIAIEAHIPEQLRHPVCTPPVSSAQRPPDRGS